MRKLMGVFILSLLITVVVMPTFINEGRIFRVHAQDNEIIIGVVTSRSGVLSYYGDMEINGLILGLMYELNINDFEIVETNFEWKLTWGDKVIRIVAEDDVDPSTGLPDASIASQKAKLLIEDKKADILQGCASSDSAIAVSKVASQYGVVFLVSPAADSDVTGKYFNRYTFQISSNTWHDALTGADWAVKNLGKKFAFIAPAYSWGYSTVEKWKAVIEKAGGTVVDIEYAPLTTTDFTPYLKKILDSDAEVLIPVWSGSSAINLYQQMKELGIYEKMNVTSGIPDVATYNLVLFQYLPTYIGMMKYAWSLPDNDVNNWLIDKYVELFKQSKLPTMGALIPAFPLPDLFVGNGFMTGQAIALALKKTNGDTSADALISALEGLEFDSPKGKAKIRAEDHRTIQDMYIAQMVWDNTTIKNYYDSPDELGAFWNYTWVYGMFVPKLIDTYESVTPPIETGFVLTPFMVQIIMITIILIVVLVGAVAFYYFRIKKREAT